MEDFKSLLKSEFSPYGILTADQLDQMEQHYQLLLQWNKKLNLTRITGLLDAVRYHSYPGARHGEQIFHLIRREIRYGDNHIRILSGMPRLGCKAGSEFRRGVIAS